MIVVKYIKKVNLILPILFLILLTGACADSIVPDIGQENLDEGDLVPVKLNLQGLFDHEGASTYSLTDIGDKEGTGAENTINDVTVYIFNSTFQCEKIIQRTSQPFTPVDTVLVPAGNKYFIALVNSVGKIPATYDPGNESTISYTALRQQLTDIITVLPSSPFLMTGEKTAVLEPYKTHSLPNSVDIEVKRAVAKVKIFITKSDKAETHDLYMNSITLGNGANSVYMLQKPASDAGITYNTSSTEKTIFNRVDDKPFHYEMGSNPNPEIPLNTTNEYCMLADTFYTYETLCGKDTSKAVYFDLAVQVGGNASNIRNARVYLAENIIGGDTIYNVYRNYWYNVYINIKDAGLDSVKVEVISCPWNVADPIDTIMGGGGIFETAIPFKLVKNYTVNDLDWNNSSSTFINNAAIENHSKGASWIKFNVSSGMAWRFKLNDENASRNQNVKVRIDNGAWQSFPTTGNKCIEGTGDGSDHKLYIYRPYVENAEPELGPMFYVELLDPSDGVFKFNRNFVVQPRDITPVPTNSYILRPALSGVNANATRAYIPLAGVYSYWEDHVYENYTNSNINRIPNGNISAELLWQDRSGVINHTSPDFLKIINDDKRDSAYLFVQATGVKGNAVVAIKVGGTIYWSFHIWVTEYNPYEAAGQKLYKAPGAGAGNAKNVFMDRNLGAMNNQYDSNGEAIGLYFQFGRKDPFPRSQSWINGAFLCYNASGTLQTSLITSSTSISANTTTLRPLQAIRAAIENPTIFYNITSAWPLQSEGASWNTPQGNKTAFDPCPEGWRIPGMTTGNSPWGGITSDFAYLSNSTDMYYYGRYNPEVGYYPTTGIITSNSVTIGGDRSTNYWTSFPSTPTAQGTGLNITTSGINESANILKYTGNQVRCVVDLNYLKRTGGGLFGKEGNIIVSEITP